MPTCGSLFSGVGLLDIGLHLAGVEHRWMCESDSWRRELLRARFGVPVHDDIRTLRGQAAANADGRRCEERAQRGGHAVGHRMEDGARSVDLIAGGFPCKGASSAGKQNGFEHAETVLWHEMRRVIGELQPRYVVIENVRDVLSVALAPGEPAGSLWGAVLADMAALGFDVVWDCLPAAAIGAPHLRDRVFAIATDAERVGRPARTGLCARATWTGPGSERRGRSHDVGAQAPADAASRSARRYAEDAARRLATELQRGDGIAEPAPDAGSVRCERRTDQRCQAGGDALDRDPSSAGGVAVDWGDYRPAIARWEAIHGPAPEPLVRRLDDGDAKLRRVRARVDRSRLSALGDGVHVYVGWLAGEYVMELERERLAA